jgi:hypothetical protein
VVQHLHVAGVGGVAVEDLGGELAAAHGLGQRRVFDRLEAGAQCRVGQEEVPEPGGPGLVLQVLDQRHGLPAGPVAAGVQPVVGLAVGGFGRQHMLGHEGLQALAHLSAPGLGAKSIGVSSRFVGPAALMEADGRRASYCE